MDYIAKDVDIVSFNALDKVKLYGMLIKPQSATEIAVLHLHGLGGSFYGSSYIPYLASEAKANGIAFFSMQNRGSYIIEEYDYANKKKSFLAGAALERFEDCIYDIGGAIKELASLGYRKIFLEGHSTGCQKILYYMSSKASKKSMALISGIVLLSPVDDHNYDKKIYGKRFSSLMRKAKELAKKHELLMPSKLLNEDQKVIGPERFLSTAITTMPEAAILNYRAEMKFIRAIKKPMLVVFGSKDEFMIDTPVEQAVKRIKEEYKGPMLYTSIIKGVDHSFHGKAELMAKEVFKFYAKVISR